MQSPEVYEVTERIRAIMRELKANVPLHAENSLSNHSV
ncbi:hypothetical protein PALB_35330 [Pseudoalteromonas luteoviolacea B = ATCC 29581]|nr:hypothetical protein PALB_35330 [Pseudoalteromonas luteoviolacea B = ATCC 29581]